MTLMGLPKAPSACKCHHVILTATKWTVQPETRTPACRACFWAFTPLNEGSRDG